MAEILDSFMSMAKFQLTSTHWILLRILISSPSLLLGFLIKCTE